METTTTGRPADPATSAFMRESRDAAGAPTSTRVTKHQRVTNHNFQTTSKPHPRVSLNFNNHDFPRRAVETIDENWETVPVSSGIPFLNLLSPAWSGIFYKREQSAGLGTSWTRVTIRIVPGGQRRQR